MDTGDDEGEAVEIGKSGSQRRVWWIFDAQSWSFCCTHVDPGCPFPCIEAPPSWCSGPSRPFPLVSCPEASPPPPVEIGWSGRKERPGAQPAIGPDLLVPGKVPFND